MQAISSALNALLEDGSWFTRARDHALWVVRVRGDLRKTALQIVMGLEFHADNRAPWVLCEEAHGAGDDGWAIRGNVLLANWSARRDAFREREGIEMPPVALGGRAPASGLALFRDVAAALLAAQRAPLDGSVVIVLAPTVVDDVEAMGRDLASLALEPALAWCRFVWVLDASLPVPSLLERMGRGAMGTDCVPDEAQEKRDMQAMLSAPPARIGRAAPRGVTPPRRVDEPPPIDPAVRDRIFADKTGLSPEYLTRAPELQRCILGAAVAMKEGRGDDAIRLQTAARDIAGSLGLDDATVIAWVALASYLSGLGRRAQALAELDGAIALAAARGLGLQEAQARLGRGLLLALERRFPEAAREYAECARRAERADVPLLAIEGWRLAAQIGLQAGVEAPAIECLREAIRVAEGSPPDTVRISSAAEAARKLASLCAARGMPAQAESLHAQADAMDAGAIGTPAAERPPVAMEASP